MPLSRYTLGYHCALCPCSTGRRCHSASAAYEKMNRYAVGLPRWFGGTSPALLFRMCCVSTTYRWRKGDAHAAHMAYEWRCHCASCRVWELDHCVFMTQVACAQRTSHVRAVVNAILWRMVGVCTAHGLRTCRTYKYTSLYVSCGCDISKCPCSWIHMYLNVLFHLSNLNSHVYHKNDIVLMTGRMIC